MPAALDPGYKHADISLSDENRSASLSGNDGVSKLVFGDTAHSWGDQGNEWAWDTSFAHPWNPTATVGFGVAKDAARASLTGTLRASSDAIMFYSDGYLWDGPHGASYSKTAWPVINGTEVYGGFRFRIEPYTNQIVVVQGNSAVQTVTLSGGDEGPWYPVLEMANNGGGTLLCKTRWTPDELHQSYFAADVGWWYPVPFQAIDNRNKYPRTGYVPFNLMGI